MALDLNRYSQLLMSTLIPISMKPNFTLILILNLFFFTLHTTAQTTYTISSSSNWSSVLPGTCANCTINITGGAVLTIDKSVTCQNCIFQGGAVTMTNETLNIQYSGAAAVTTYFTNINFTINGNSSKVVVNAPLSLSGSTFTFNDASAFSTSYEVDLTASRINLYDNSSMTSTGSSATTINLVNSSKISIGNGSQTSSALFTVSGPTLNDYDNSSIAIGNDNNIYYNWSSYDASAGAAASARNAYTTSTSTMNCGGTYAHKCSNPSLYGPATLTSAGVIPGNTLPVILVGFTAGLNSNKTITLDWNTQQEVNAGLFAIERSADGNAWNEIGTVQAKGNSSTETEYSFTDENPLSGVNYYRLKMADLDNNNVYTQVIVVRAAIASNISFFPNPAHDYVNVTLEGNSATQVTVRLINQSGQVLQEKRIESGSGTIVTFPLQQVPAGLYILSVAGADGTRENSKLLISRS
jgi:hypothetical protein